MHDQRKSDQRVANIAARQVNDRERYQRRPRQLRGMLPRAEHGRAQSEQAELAAKAAIHERTDPGLLKRRRRAIQLTQLEALLELRIAREAYQVVGPPGVLVLRQPRFNRDSELRSCLLAQQPPRRPGCGRRAQIPDPYVIDYRTRTR